MLRPGTTLNVGEMTVADGVMVEVCFLKPSLKMPKSGKPRLRPNVHPATVQMPQVTTKWHLLSYTSSMSQLTMATKVLRRPPAWAFARITEPLATMPCHQRCSPKRKNDTLTPRLAAFSSYIRKAVNDQERDMKYGTTMAKTMTQVSTLPQLARASDPNCQSMICASSSSDTPDPNLRKLDPLRIGQTPEGALDCDLASEHGAHDLYTEARKHCEAVGKFIKKVPSKSFSQMKRVTLILSKPSFDPVAKLGEEKFAVLNASKLMKPSKRQRCG